MTGSPVASWYPDASLDPIAAAIHVYELAFAFNAAVRAALGVLLPRRPPPPPCPRPPPNPPVGAVPPVVPVGGLPPVVPVGGVPNPPRPKPPGPPWPDDGPAVGIEPVCGVLAVSRANATGAPTAVSIEPAAMAPATPRFMCPMNRTANAAARPTTRIVGRNHDSNVGVRRRSTCAHHVVTTIAIDRNTRDVQCSRWRHSSVPPMPTSAPIAGARATV